MISKIKLNWFQSHKRTEISLSKGVNIITGASDAGKSSIIRALIWAFYNRPLGDSVVNWNTQERDKTKVSVLFEDGELLKERHKGKSKYKVGDVELEALKQEVPDEVEKLTNLSDCNIQTQHEPYFLLNESSGEVARKLNEIVGLDIIDTIFRNIDKRIRSTSSDIQSVQTEIENTEKHLDSLKDADALFEKATLLKSKFFDLSKSEKRIEKCNEVCSKIRSISDQIESSKVPKNAEGFVLRIEAIVDRYKTMSKRYEALLDITTSLSKIHDDHHGEKEWVKCEDLYVPLIGLVKKYETLTIRKRDLSTLVSRFNKAETEKLEEKRKKDELIEEYKDKLQKAKTCPFCYSPITSSTIKDMVKNI